MIIDSPITTVSEVRIKAGLVWNPDVLDADITRVITQVDWVLRSHVSSRYDISDFTDVKFSWSKTYEFLKSIAMEMASAILLFDQYGIQNLSEDNGAVQKYNLQMTTLKEIAEGKIRLLDSSFSEFALLPKAGKTIQPATSNFISTIPNERTFGVDKKR